MWRTFQQDISEFVSVVTGDAKEALSSVLQTPSEHDNTHVMRKSCDKSNTNLHSTLSAQDEDLLSLQRDPKTYTEAIAEEDKERWQIFLAQLNLDTKQDEIARLLEDQEHVARLYNVLISSDQKHNDGNGTGNQIDHETFWSRYFFKVESLLRPQRDFPIPLNLTDGDDEEDLSWGDEDEDVSGKKDKSAEGVRAPGAEGNFTEPTGASKSSSPMEEPDLDHAASSSHAQNVVADSAVNENGVTKSNRVTHCDEEREERSDTPCTSTPALEAPPLQAKVEKYENLVNEMRKEISNLKSKCTTLERQCADAIQKEGRVVAQLSGTLTALKQSQDECLQLRKQCQDLKEQQPKGVIQQENQESVQQMRVPEVKNTIIRREEGSKQDERDYEELESWS
ncbi:hypothetical protein NSK_006705 [Nannochloropsis salina CCMP1776]|jgi:hypothetical protein|uniref:BSD domain-containing protein n=1 Tax=Nannochloropsis salina CCMP1776 TaxID=1027361 RepID=A0A4D9CVB1_9STRA|nr:hypothetical protein NSK_006705 [Nannochloropsis salina CCMP1776]|eukprot:TFJ82037.1 hypothetical protein NSK_006705 [Nannochloropsis salina CCMP1776]